MYIKNIQISNFRKIKTLKLDFNKHLNFIIWENDSWKTALIDWLKLVLWTISNDYIKLENDDFNDTSKDIIIELVIVWFDEEQQIKFLDWWWEWEWIKLKFRAEKKWDRIFSKVLAWPIESEEDGKYLESDIKELLNSVYLKPLRDAENDLNAWKNSRLSKILLWHKYFKWKERWHDLIEKFERLNNEIKNYFGRPQGWESDVINQIINNHFEEFMWENKNVSIDTWKPDLQNILEKLSLEFENNKKPWLWTSNLLFIASELLLLHERTKSWLWIALIEELEAHIHPQKQLTLIDYLQKKSREEDIQIFITSHSPNIASKVDLHNIIICKDAIFYPLKNWKTKLEEKDYKFLKRFLDVTKADLFFAKWLIFVEWIAEAILIPTIAELFDINLNRKWISIINLNGLSFERYLKVFLNDEWKNYLWIKIACITDRDWKDKEDFIQKKIKQENSWNIPSNFLKKNSKDEDVFDIKKFFEYKINDWKIEEYFIELLPKEYIAWEMDIKYFYNNIKTLEFDLSIWDFFYDLLQSRRNMNVSWSFDWDIKIEEEYQKNKYLWASLLYKKLEATKWDFAQELALIWEWGEIIKKWIEEQKSKEEINEELKNYKEELKEKFIKDPYVKYILKALEHVTWEPILSSNNWWNE